MKKIIVLLITTFFGSSYCVAQESNNSIAITPIDGVKISTASNDGLKGAFYGTELSYQINMDNNNADWVRMLNVKDISVAATYINMQHVSRNGIPSTRGVIGSNYGINGRLDILLANTGKTNVLLSPGLGLVYITQTFYTDKNFIVGSHVNAVLQLGMKVETPVSDMTSIQFGINLLHYSNASTQLPNNGINLAVATIGIVQKLSKEASSFSNHTEEWYEGDSNHSFEFSVGAGRRDQVKTGIFKNPYTPGQWYFYDTTGTVKKTSSNLYQVGMYAGYNYKLNPVIGLKIGSDVVYYTHPFTYRNFLKTYQSTFSSYDHVSVGMSVGADLWLGRFAVTGMYGYYLHFNSLRDEHTYITGGIKYFVLPWMALNAKVYWHGSDPHYANFGILFTTDAVFNK